MTGLPVEYGLGLAAVLLLCGLLGVLVRRNVLFVLMSLEIMLNAAGLAFIVAGARWQAPDGQVMFIVVLTMAAAEVAVGLALALQILRRTDRIDTDALNRLRG